jgi:hypothetical protein
LLCAIGLQKEKRPIERKQQVHDKTSCCQAQSILSKQSKSRLKSKISSQAHKRSCAQHRFEPTINQVLLTLLISQACIIACLHPQY